MALKFEFTHELGRVITYHRKRAGLSRAELSEMAGVGPTVIYELEHGKESVQFNIIRRILGVLNLRLSVEGPMMNEYERNEKS